MKRSFFLALLAPVALAGSLQAAVFLEIDGIKGESRDSQHPGTIEIESFSWGATHTPASGAGGGAGKVSFSDIHFTSSLTKATPQLLIASASGAPIPTAKLHVRKAGEGQTAYYVITLENILISSLQQSGRNQSSTSTNDPPPTDSFSLNFEKVTLRHTAEDGTVTTGTAIRTPVQ